MSPVSVLADHYGGSDHVGGAALAFWTFGHVYGNAQRPAWQGRILVGTSTWNFVFPADNVLRLERELIDLPVDFYLRVKYSGSVLTQPLPTVTMMLERTSEPKTETHLPWLDDPPYYGYGKKVIIKIERRADVDYRQQKGIIEITFQTAPF